MDRLSSRRVEDGTQQGRRVCRTVSTDRREIPGLAANGNGFHQFWSRGGTELFYTAGPGSGQWFVVNVVTRPVFTLGVRMQLADYRNLQLSGNAPVLPRNYDITSDGKRIIVVRTPSAREAVEASTSINIVLNWQEELKQRVPTR